MNRHYARVISFQVLYESDFREIHDIKALFKRHIGNLELDGENVEFARELVEKAYGARAELDKTIEEVAPEWPIEKVAVIDRNILRLAICELKYFDTPPKVVINESIEIAKTFGSETSSKFINGVLGTVYRKSEKYNESEIENEK